MDQALLEKRKSLPEKPQSTRLIGQHVRLEPLVIARDTQRLFEVSNGKPFQLGEHSVPAYDCDELIWRYMFDGPYDNVQDLAISLQKQIDASNGLCLCVFDNATGQQIGVTNLMNNVPSHLKIELGGIWYCPAAQGTFANAEATYLMLKHCFELGYRRIEWKCHSHNQRSRKAALRLGFQFEGVQESHMIVKNSSRDTAWYRILKHEWPIVKHDLERYLYFDK
ncbi:MAG: GNAT family protein [Parachlamydiales bacterium]|jgi:hypothetical protein